MLNSMNDVSFNFNFDGCLFIDEYINIPFLLKLQRLLVPLLQISKYEYT